MSKTSPAAVAFHETFDRAFLPLLERLGFARAKPRNVRPGLLAASAARPLGGARRLEATVWCDGGTGASLRFRLDLVEPVNGVECSEQIALRVPTRGAPEEMRTSLDFAGGDFRPHESIEQLKTALTFLAGGLAANAALIAEAVPELAETLSSASAEPCWMAAAERARELWSNRHVRGGFDDARVPATVVYASAQLVMVEAAGARQTFKFDARSFDRSLPVWISGRFRTPAGTMQATRLINGETTWQFAVDGRHLPLDGL